MRSRPQFSLANLFILVTCIALATGFIRLVLIEGEAVSWWIDLLLAIFVGGLLFSIGAWMTFHAARVALFWPSAPARIVRHVIRRIDDQPFYHPVVSFRTRDGQSVIAIAGSAWWRRPWPRGKQVPVRYNPQKPRWIEITASSNLWGFAPPLYVFGILLFLTCLVYGLPRYVGTATMFDVKSATNPR